MVLRESLGEFKQFREKMKEKILTAGNLQIQLFFNLDTHRYEDGALPECQKKASRRREFSYQNPAERS